MTCRRMSTFEYLAGVVMAKKKKSGGFKPFKKGNTSGTKKKKPSARKGRPY